MSLQNHGTFRSFEESEGKRKDKLQKGIFILQFMRKIDVMSSAWRL